MTINFYLADFYQLQSLCFEFLHIFEDFEDDVALDGHCDGGWWGQEQQRVTGRRLETSGGWW